MEITGAKELFGDDVTAIIPAYNEENNIAYVLTALTKTNLFKEIIVINDGSIDETSAVANTYTVTVLDLPKNIGKSQALYRGVEEATSEYICLFDADVRGLTTQHMYDLISPVLRGEVDMTNGIRDRGFLLNWLSVHVLPKLSGERAMKRETFLSFPREHMHGLSDTIVMDFFLKRSNGTLLPVLMKNTRLIKKIKKVGIIRGLIGYVKMGYGMATTYALLHILY
ncbi:glycosyltransferase family 2 protein [Candidatus Kaiserbacteria bacterium]|nr:glycosyltransferase family 2 protein [Candidatus Kaiserbacteria bacterium]